MGYIPCLHQRNRDTDRRVFTCDEARWDLPLPEPLYDRYRQSGDKEKFLRGHENGIILFETATKELKKLGAVPLPSTKRMEKELAALTERKDTLLDECRTAQSQAQEYEITKQNVGMLLVAPKELSKNHLET